MTGHPELADDAPMQISRNQLESRTKPSSWPEARLVDALLEGWVDWRESASAVADAYARWSFASGSDRALRFAAYTATLDQEQKAAAAYADAATALERCLQRS